MKAPLSPDSVSRNMPVSWFLTVTVTPGIDGALRVDHPAADLGRPLLRPAAPTISSHANIQPKTRRLINASAGSRSSRDGPAPSRNTER